MNDVDTRTFDIQDMMCTVVICGVICLALWLNCKYGVGGSELHYMSDNAIGGTYPSNTTILGANQLSADLSKLPQDHPILLVPPPPPDPPNPQ